MLFVVCLFAAQFSRQLLARLFVCLFIVIRLRTQTQDTCCAAAQRLRTGSRDGTQAFWDTF